MNEIISPQNNFIKNLKKLLKKKGRVEQGAYLLEGEHLVLEGLKSETEISSLLFTQSFLNKKSEFVNSFPNIEQFLVTDDIIKQLSSVPTPQGIIAVAQFPVTATAVDMSKPILLLDNVQDPGNVGTMIRTADAAGFGTVILGEGTADIFNDKVLRSMQGSHFHINIIEKPILPFMKELQSQAIPVYGTELNPQAISYREVELSKVFGVVMGNEGQGVEKDILNQTTKNIYIPIEGQAESLNVAVAAGILMFGLKR